jgi:hypothetical protein
LYGNGTNAFPYVLFPYKLECSGKGLGGSSAINFMCWTRPPAKEIDGASPALLSARSLALILLLDIERLGNPGWNWETLDKSLKQLEKYALHFPSLKLTHDECSERRYVAPDPEVVKEHGLGVEGWSHRTEGTSLYQSCRMPTKVLRLALPRIPEEHPTRGKRLARRKLIFSCYQHRSCNATETLQTMHKLGFDKAKASVCCSVCL